MQFFLFGEGNRNKNIVTISKTDFIDFQKCRYTWYMRKVLQVTITPTTNMIKGSDMHIIARQINNSLKNGEIKNLEDIHNLTLRLELEDTVRSGIENFIRYLENRHHSRMPYIPRMVEEKLEYTIRDNYKIHGIPDAVYLDTQTNSWEIVEYKKSTYKNEEDIFLEAMFYGYILENTKKVKVEKVSFFSFDSGYSKTIYYSSSDVEKRIFDMVELLDKMDFKPNPSESICKMCLFRRNCPHSKG